MRKILLAGNWKMNKLARDLQPFAEGMSSTLEKLENVVIGKRPEVAIAVAAPLFYPWQELVKKARLPITIAAQNMHWAESGAFTGEISAGMLKEVGITMTLIGHSERRQYFGETDETVAKRTQTALAQGLVPVVCIGETLQEREAGKTEEVVERQLRAVTKVCPDLGSTIVAYEPVWAIGTGKSATTAQAQEVHAFIRKLLVDLLGKAKAETVRILYGGSASPANIRELLLQPDIDGGLIGGASLKPEDFSKMLLDAIDVVSIKK